MIQVFIEHTGYTIGGFFEYISIGKIKERKLELPNGGYDIEIRVPRICDMLEIKPKLSEILNNALVSENLDNNKSQTEEINIDKESIEENPNYSNISKVFNKLPKTTQDYFQNNFILEDTKIEQAKQSFNKPGNFIQLKNEKGEILFQENPLFKIENISKNNNYFQGIIKNENHKIKNRNILLTQSIENAPIFDLGYLFGPSEEKIFIGFQMKSYKDKYKTSFKFSKKKVIEKSKQLLITSKYLFGVNIVEFHYIIVGMYINSEEIKICQEERLYSQNLIKYCKSNKIELILYDPLKKIFLTPDKQPITTLLLENLKYSNVFDEDYKKIFKFEDSDYNYNKFLKTRIKLRCFDLEEAIESVVGYLDEQTIINKINTFFNQISELLGINNIKFVSKEFYNEQSGIIPLPGDNFLFMCKYKAINNVDNINKDCFLVKKKEQELFLYLYQTNEIFTNNYPIQFFALMKLDEPYYIFTFKNLEQ